MRPTWHSRSTSTHMHQDAIDEASCTMGLSLGEYSALCFAGAMSFEDGVKVTKVRGEAMQAAADLTESGMASVIGLDMEKVGRVRVYRAAGYSLARSQPPPVPTRLTSLSHKDGSLPVLGVMELRWYIRVVIMCSSPSQVHES
jgi:hypothetical protein